MDKLELIKALDELLVGQDSYSLNDDILPDRLVLYQNYNKWEVFYFDERGNRHDEKVFTSEDEACNYIIKYFKRQKDTENLSSTRSYPEPVKDELIIKCSDEIINKVQVMNSVGKVVIELNNINAYCTKLNTSGLQKGTYLWWLTTVTGKTFGGQIMKE